MITQIGTSSSDPHFVRVLHRRGALSLPCGKSEQAGAGLGGKYAGLARKTLHESTFRAASRADLPADRLHGFVDQILRPRVVMAWRPWARALSAVWEGRR